MGSAGYGRDAMRLHSAKVPQIAAEMMSALLAEGGIETESPREVQRDLEAVLLQYVRDDQDLTDRARDMAQARKLPAAEQSRIKRQLAEQRNMKVGDDAMDYVLDQLLEMLMHSRSVEEIFGEDYELRRRMRGPLRKAAQLEDELKKEAMSQLKHVQEGSSTWEVEYRRVMEDIKRRKGL